MDFDYLKNPLEIRRDCVAKGLNEALGRSCTDEDLCLHCEMRDDVGEYDAMYRGAGEVEVSD